MFKFFLKLIAVGVSAVVLYKYGFTVEANFKSPEKPEYPEPEEPIRDNSEAYISAIKSIVRLSDNFSYDSEITNSMRKIKDLGKKSNNHVVKAIAAENITKLAQKSSYSSTKKLASSMIEELF